MPVPAYQEFVSHASVPQGFFLFQLVIASGTIRLLIV